MSWAPWVDAIARRLFSQLSVDAESWLKTELKNLTVDGGGFSTAWSRAGRRLGHQRLELGTAEMNALETAGAQGLIQASVAGWGRLLLLFKALGQGAVPGEAPVAAPGSGAGGLSFEEQPLVVEELFRRGEIGEQSIILRALAFLPGPDRFLQVGISGVRSNAALLVEAIGCDNPYPALHFPDAAWNQMIMKMLFLDLPLSQVVDLKGRLTQETARMAAAFAEERRAEGRSVPADVHKLLPQGE